MKESSPFQLIILVVAGFAILIGVIVFAFTSYKGGTTLPLMTIWGTIPADVMTSVINNIITEEGEGSVNVSYREIREEEFDTFFVEQLAEGKGPDLVILPQELLVRHQNKFLTVSYEFYPERTFKNTFIEEGELFTHQDGVMGLPFTIDPLVMYWNRTHFTNEGIPNPPQYWDELLSIVPDLTDVDSTFTIFKSAVALGEIENITNGKEIFQTLALQAGNPLVVRDEDTPGVYDKYNVILDSRLGYSRAPLETALTYFSQFSNPSKSVYSWNRSLPSSQDRFVSGDLSIYFGFASEVNVIRKRNPNLNFDVSFVPESKGGGSATFGKMSALMVTNSTSNPTEAFRVASKLTEPLTAQYIADQLNIPPVRKDLLAVKQSSDAIKDITYQSALRAQGVYDLDPSKTENILQDMIESYTSGRLRESQAVTRAQGEFQALIKN